MIRLSAFASTVPEFMFNPLCETVLLKTTFPCPLIVVIPERPALSLIPPFIVMVLLSPVVKVRVLSLYMSFVSPPALLLLKVTSSEIALIVKSPLL